MIANINKSRERAKKKMKKKADGQIIINEKVMEVKVSERNR